MPDVFIDNNPLHLHVFTRAFPVIKDPPKKAVNNDGKVIRDIRSTLRERSEFRPKISNSLKFNPMEIRSPQTPQ